MLIKTKLRAGSVLLALVPALLVGGLIGWYADDHAKTALEDQAKARLVALREDRATQIVNYFDAMRSQAQAYAKDRMTIDALRRFHNSFHSLQDEVPVDLAQARTTLQGYYKSDFLGQFSKRNNGESTSIDALLQKLGDHGILFQDRYIGSNPNPLGNKDKLIDKQDGSSYARDHALFHPGFRELQQRFGYYDIFLIDADTGDVMYTVFKELDYATSLKTGPYADSGLGKAFRGALGLPDNGSVFMTDFEPYLPSYNDPAAFIAIPVFDQGEQLGVIAFQLPIDRINQVMTGNGKWQDSGLGESGETYLIGSDMKMRSQSRFFIEDPQGFLTAIGGAGVPGNVLDAIRAKETVIGLQPVNSPGAQRAIGGTTGFDVFDDYRGVPVLSAYKPVEIGSLKWAILAEIDQQEAYAAATELRHDIVYLMIGTALVLALASAAIGWIFSMGVTAPLGRILASMRDISSGSGDLTVRLDDKSNDELGQLGGAFNTFVTKLEGIMVEVGHSTDEMAVASEELSTITRDTRQGVEQQQGEIQQVATAIEEMTATVRDVAHSTNATADAARHAGSQVHAGREVLERNTSAIQLLSQRMNESKEIVHALHADSTKVGSVLDVIQGIAEQTNLLALNAAIEAARAGEQGRGFAVVADEVRILAQRTQQSTEEIRETIETLQSRSAQTTRMLNENNEDLGTTVQLTEQTEKAFGEIEQSVQELLDMSTHIASATEEQASVTEEISRNVDNIYQVAQSTASGAEQTMASSEMLARLGDQLKALVKQFKVSG
ncbi:MAG: methyl-accepting chemotaxis protein [Candidatus Thiodiazotropha sp.]